MYLDVVCWREKDIRKSQIRLLAGAAPATNSKTLYTMELHHIYISVVKDNIDKPFPRTRRRLGYWGLTMPLKRILYANMLHF